MRIEQGILSQVSKKKRSYWLSRGANSFSFSYLGFYKVYPRIGTLGSVYQMEITVEVPVL